MFFFSCPQEVSVFLRHFTKCQHHIDQSAAWVIVEPASGTTLKGLIHHVPSLIMGTIALDECHWMIKCWYRSVIGLLGQLSFSSCRIWLLSFTNWVVLFAYSPTNNIYLLPCFVTNRFLQKYLLASEYFCVWRVQELPSQLRWRRWSVSFRISK